MKQGTIGLRCSRSKEDRSLNRIFVSPISHVERPEESIHQNKCSPFCKARAEADHYPTRSCRLARRKPKAVGLAAFSASRTNTRAGWKAPLVTKLALDWRRLRVHLPTRQMAGHDERLVGYLVLISPFCLGTPPCRCSRPVEQAWEARTGRIAHIKRLQE